MSKKLSKADIQFLIEHLQQSEAIPQDYKYKLFPTEQKEYELVYGGKMRANDVLANEDGVFAVPLQTEKEFNGDREVWQDGWKNIIAFGDNLQFLKTIYEDKDPLIKGKVKGKVKLIYIDPPFGTGSEYDGSNGQKAYSARTKGAEFIEFLRKRLIVAQKILADDGCIFVRLDYHFSHYAKLILDEIFGKNNFRNEIIINRTRTLKGEHKQFATATDSLFLYAKNKGIMLFNGFRILKPEKEWKWVDMHLPGERKDKNLLWRNIFDKQIKAPNGRRWTLSQDGFNNAIEKRLVRWNNKKQMPEFLTKWYTLGSNWTDIPGYSKTVNYPTENSEQLLQRVLKCCSNEGDIVLDFFGGSGTTCAVAEKLNRKWITCDIGKLAFYTMQKRMLNIANSKSLENPKKKYDKEAKAFTTINTGVYDLEKVFKLEHKAYCDFVMRLFEVEAKPKKINGIQIDGQRKDGFGVMIWQYWNNRDADVGVDEDYLQELHSHIGKRIGERLYIIVPASFVRFFSEYYQIDKTRYYFLKVPYHLIKELHQVPFKNFRQPTSKKNVNDLEDAIGFHFIKPPEISSKIEQDKQTIAITLEKFISDFSEDNTANDMQDFESLAMVLIDKNFNGRFFDMDECYFADELIANGQCNLPSINKKDCGKQIMLIYVDVFGNDFKEIFTIER